jgi:hypothetical protein
VRSCMRTTTRKASLNTPERPHPEPIEPLNKPYSWDVQPPALWTLSTTA